MNRNSKISVLAAAGALLAVMGIANAAEPAGNVAAATGKLQDYAQTGQLEAPAAGKASLYATPWRSNVRTVAAAEALKGIGVYYKHIPQEWTMEQQVHIIGEMGKAGVSRMRLAPHLAIYITANWTKPQDKELEALREELTACFQAHIRPCVVFVHIPPVGKPGTKELQEWWTQGELMPAGEVGSPEFKAYQDKTYEALMFVLNEARSAGFTGKDSYDLEMGQNLWWGAPAVPRPMPSTGVEAINPGGRIYEFDKGLIERLRNEGYIEPTLWWGETHHHFEHTAAIPDECVGPAVSIYSCWTGATNDGWLTGGQYDKEKRGPNDVWPSRDPLTFADGKAPDLILARPETYMADRTRRDNLIELLNRLGKPVAITSLGTVPSDIPDAKAGGFNGWELKSRGLSRSLAFWLNQGASFVLLHSAYEPGAADKGEMAHSLIPELKDADSFKYTDAPPLVALHAFTQGLAGAQPIEKTTELSFQYSLEKDAVLIPASTGSDKVLHASDAVALLSYQIDAKNFAVAAYVVSPNISLPVGATKMTLHIDKKLSSGKVTTLVPATQQEGEAQVVSRDAGGTTITLDVNDNVKWVKFQIE